MKTDQSKSPIEQFKATHEEMKKLHRESMDNEDLSLDELKVIGEKQRALADKQFEILANSRKKKPLSLSQKILVIICLLFSLFVVTLAVLGPNA